MGAIFNKMKFETKYKICLHKGYFDTGLSLTSYVKYFVALIGMASIVINQNLGAVMVLMLIYGAACYLIGLGWYKYGWIEAAHEVTNRFNLFMKEMRKKIK